MIPASTITEISTVKLLVIVFTPYSVLLILFWEVNKRYTHTPPHRSQSSFVIKLQLEASIRLFLHIIKVDTRNTLLICLPLTSLVEALD